MATIESRGLGRLGDDPRWIDPGSILDRISQDCKDRSLSSKSVEIAHLINA
jgi:hypothetical protein